MTLLTYLGVQLALCVWPFVEIDPRLPGEAFDAEDIVMARFPGVLVAQYEQGMGVREAMEKDRVTLHVVVVGEDGRELVNSRKRGLPLIVELDMYGFWSRLAWGMQRGDKRLVYLPAEQGFGDLGAPGIIPGGANLWIDVEAIDLVPVGKITRR